jgi:hypothetical protein
MLTLMSDCRFGLSCCWGEEISGNDHPSKMTGNHPLGGNIKASEEESEENSHGSRFFCDD